MNIGLLPIGYTQKTGLFQQGTTQSPLGSPPPSNQPDRDTVNISTQGKFSLISSRFHPDGNNNVSVQSIEEDFRDLSSHVEDNLRALYRQTGISPSSKMQISVGGDGHILVNGDSPQAESLAAKINADDELSNEIRGMSSMASLLEAIKKQQEFAAAYDKNPEAAVERFGYMLEDGHDYHTSFTMQNGHIDTEVQYI